MIRFDHRFNRFNRFFGNRLRALPMTPYFTESFSTSPASCFVGDPQVAPVLKHLPSLWTFSQAGGGVAAPLVVRIGKTEE